MDNKFYNDFQILTLAPDLKQIVVANLNVYRNSKNYDLYLFALGFAAGNSPLIELSNPEAFTSSNISFNGNSFNSLDE